PEKARIMNHNVPAVVTERNETIAHIFEDKAKEMEVSLRFATDERRAVEASRTGEGLLVRVEDLSTGRIEEWEMALSGLYQQKNLLGDLTAVDVMRLRGRAIADDHEREGWQA